MEIQKMLDEYTGWLRSEITVTNFGEYHELTTPYLDRYNDYLQIYVKPEADGRMATTDDSYIIDNLISAGMSFKAGAKRKIMLDRILQNFSLQLDGNAITTTATASNFPQKKHQMGEDFIRYTPLTFDKFRQKQTVHAVSSLVRGERPLPLRDRTDIVRAGRGSYCSSIVPLISLLRFCSAMQKSAPSAR